MAEPSSTRLRSRDKAQEPIAPQGSGARAGAAGLWARLGLARGVGPLCLPAALAAGVAPALPALLVALGQLLWGPASSKHASSLMEAGKPQPLSFQAEAASAESPPRSGPAWLPRGPRRPSGYLLPSDCALDQVSS